MVNTGNIFSNGCLQQAYFIYKQLKKTFDRVQFGTVHESYTKFDVVDIPVRNIIKTCLFDVKIVINVSLSVHNKLMYKLHGINVIDLFCGNVYTLHQEQYIFNSTNKTLLEGITTNIADEIYTFPMYKEHTGYIDLLYNVPVTVIPHYWDSEIVDKYVTTKKLDVQHSEFAYPDIGKKKYTFLVFEPNISIHKTSLVPLFICQRIYDKYPDLVDGIDIYCTQKNIEIGAECLKFKILQKGLVKFKSRPILLDVLHELKTQKKNIVIISHNIMNDMNFLHMELIHFGYPVIHNCLPYSSNGLYYEYENEAPSVFDRVLSNKWMQLSDPLPENLKYPDINELFSKVSCKDIENRLKHVSAVNALSEEYETIFYNESNTENLKDLKDCIVYDDVKYPHDFLEIAIKYLDILVKFIYTRGNAKISYDLSENFIILCRYLTIPVTHHCIFEKNFLIRPKTLKYLIDNKYNTYLKDHETLWLAGNLTLS